MTVQQQPVVTFRLLLLLLASLALYLSGDIDYLGTFSGVDLQYYRKMAEAAPGLATDIRAPFAYRLLAPWVAGVLPLPDPLAFKLLTWSALLFLPQYYLGWLTRRGIRLDTAFLACFFVIANKYLFSLTAFDYFQLCDAVTLLLIPMLYEAVEQKHWIRYALLATIGAFVRETALLMLPVLGWLVYRTADSRPDVRKFLSASVFVITCFTLLRMILAERVSGDWWLGLAASEYYHKVFDPVVWFRLSMNAFVPFSILLVVFFDDVRTFCRRRPEAVLFAVLLTVTVFLAADTERLITPAWFFFYWFVAEAIDRRPVGFSRMKMFFIIGSVVSSLHHLTARFPLPNRNWSLGASLIGMVIIGLSAWYLGRIPGQTLGQGDKTRI